MVTTDTKIDLSTLSGEARRVLDVYSRSRSIYQRTMAAMGRTTTYRVSVASTAVLKVGDVKRTAT